MSTAGKVDSNSENDAVSDPFVLGADSDFSWKQLKAGVRPGRTPVLTELQNRTRMRRQRRVQPPAWAVWLSRTVPRASYFLARTVPLWLQQHTNEIKTGVTSFVIHLVIAALLALWVVHTDSTGDFLELIVTRIPDADPTTDNLNHVVQPDTLLDLKTDSTEKQMMAEIDNGLAAAERRDMLNQELQVPLDNMIDRMEVPVNAGELSGRSAAGKRAAVRKYGGSAESEQAVNAGLKWLQKIQQSDGSWSFGNPGEAGSPGSMNTTDMGATSMALLCFLGAGHTHHVDGPYRQVVTNGLTYILKNAVRQTTGADLRGRYQGNSGLYVQGLATICICEASALVPEDRELRRLAIESVSFVERSQDRSGGGWRYFPGDRGDTSVVGWQLMALQSAKMGRIRVSGSTMRNARDFLNSVQADGGAVYGYMRPDSGNPAMTAVGLLCRMYMGWKRDHDALTRGVNRLAAIGPSKSDMYYNYYATQVIHHYGGEIWDGWNSKMRPQLVETQLKEGPGAGSWDVTDPHGSSGGRIYQTALSILTLEVYYRHLPIYKDLEKAEIRAETR